MAITILSRHSNVQDRRPIPTDLEPGEISIATNTASPGLFIRDSDNKLVKIGPTYISPTAPVPTNHAALSKGETWWDGDNFKIWSGTQWDITNKLGSDFAIPLTIPEIQISTPTVNTLTFSQGAVVVISGTAKLAIKTASAITKTLSTWAAGDGNGSLIGALTASTWYHAFCIFNPSTSVIDFAIASTLTPALPSGFTYRRRLGSFLINDISVINPFLQFGSSFLWGTPVYDLAGVRVPTTKTNFTLSVPFGLNCEVKGALSPGLAEVGQILVVNAFNPLTSLPDGPGGIRDVSQAYSSNDKYQSSNFVNTSQPLWITNTSSQLAFQSSGSYNNGVGSTSFLTYGWEDFGLARGL